MGIIPSSILNSYSINIIMHLERMPKQRYQNLKTLGMSEVTLSKKLKALKHFKIIQAAASMEQDRNFVVYSLTDKGLKMAEAMKTFLLLMYDD